MSYTCTISVGVENGKSRKGCGKEKKKRLVMWEKKKNNKTKRTCCGGVLNQCATCIYAWEGQDPGDT